MIEKKRSHGRLRLLMAANTFRTVLMYLPKCVRVFLVYFLHANEIISTFDRYKNCIIFHLYCDRNYSLEGKFPIRTLLICVKANNISRISQASLISVTKTDVNRSSTKSPT